MDCLSGGGAQLLWHYERCWSSFPTPLKLKDTMVMVVKHSRAAPRLPPPSRWSAGAAARTTIPASPQQSRANWYFLTLDSGPMLALLLQITETAATLWQCDTFQSTIKILKMTEQLLNWATVDWSDLQHRMWWCGEIVSRRVSVSI